MIHEAASEAGAFIENYVPKAGYTFLKPDQMNVLDDMRASYMNAHFDERKRLKKVYDKQKKKYNNENWKEKLSNAITLGDHWKLQKAMITKGTLT